MIRTVQRVAFDHYLLACGSRYDAGSDRIGNCMVPPRLHFVRCAAHTEAIDFAIGRDCTDDDGKRVLAAAAVDDVREQESLALALLDATDELPAHERMQFRVLVDCAVYDQQQALLPQNLKMFMQVEIAARRFGHWVYAVTIRWRGRGGLPGP